MNEESMYSIIDNIFLILKKKNPGSQGQREGESWDEGGWQLLFWENGWAKPSQEVGE